MENKNIYEAIIREDISRRKHSITIESKSWPSEDTIIREAEHNNIYGSFTILSCKLNESSYANYLY